MIDQHTTRHSLRFKLLRSVAFALVLAISLSGILLLIIGNHIERENNTRNLTVIAEIIGENVAFLLGQGLPDTMEARARESLRAARHQSDIAKVCIYDRNGEFFTQYIAEGQLSNCYNSLEDARSEKLISAPFSSKVSMDILSQGEYVGHIQVESKGDNLKSALKILSLALFAAFFTAVLIAFFFGSRQVQRSLQPLMQLSKTGQAIAKNPYSKERASKLADDEVGDLVDSFNTMLDALEAENQKLVSSENTFRILSEHAPVGVFLRETPSKYSYVNDKWSEITGMSFDTTKSFVEHISTEYKRRYIESLANLKQGQNFVKVEYEFLRPNGEYRFLQEFVSAVHEGDRTYFIGTLLDNTELKNTQIELEKLAYYDPLTKLPNRRFLTDHLNFSFASAEKKHEKLAIFMTDLDNFKRINDSLGHDAGDKLLERIGGRLRQSVFKEDVVSRMGGDEFIVLVEGIENLNSVEFISKRLLNAMSTEAIQGHTVIPVTGSIGVAMYPEDASSAEELLRFADMALYDSKAAGGNCFSCYSEDLEKKIRDHVMLEQKLRKAMDNRTIDVHLQPQYHAKTEVACWAEALVRWFDEDEGYISPMRFIPVAEESGLIHDLGDYVLERVCQILDQNSDTLRELNIEGISVNLSAKQFFSAKLVNDIRSTFDKYQIDPTAIEFELTESTVTDDMEGAIAIMERLRGLGCRLSIDDFGTGYSSLSYLRQFPVTSLKIDRSFINEIPENRDDCEITRAIISLAHNLNMSVVAEGVETKEQAKFLADLDCEYLQGYLLSKPVSIDELEKRAHKKGIDRVSAANKKITSKKSS